MSDKIKLKNPLFCDGCIHLTQLPTIGQHYKCVRIGTVMLARTDIEITTNGQYKLIRPKKCVDEVETE